MARLSWSRTFASPTTIRTGGQAGKVGVLRVDAVHEDEPFSAATRAAFDAEIDDLARWLGLPLSSSR
jgi:hypothetical protein